MDSNKLQAINNIANAVRETLGINSDNFDINQVVEQLHGRIVINPFCTSEACVIKDTSNNSLFTIELDNSSYNYSRERFSIAHELGHLFIHMKYLIDMDAWNQLAEHTSHARNINAPYSVKESEANEFAAAFLMPKDRFIEYAEQTSDSSGYRLDLIASNFNVSMESAKIRGKILGLWG